MARTDDDGRVEGVDLPDSAASDDVKADAWGAIGPVVLACDAGYAMQLATTLRSIIEANRSRRTIEFHVLSDGFSTETKRRVIDSLGGGSASIQWIPVDLSGFQRFATADYISPMTYARFLIPTLFPNGVSKVLYLDADLLVLDDLEPLWETDLEGAVVGAIVDGLDSQIKGGKPEHKGLPQVRDYFNAGVLLIDLDRWRRERISERAVEYLAGNPRSPFSDQDALNVACDGLWKRLDPRWNFQDHRARRISDMGEAQRPAIVHFVTSLKPWKPSSLSLNAHFYDSFRSRTCFARTPSQARRDTVETAWCRLKRLLRRYPLARAAWRVLRPKRAVRTS